MERGRWVLRRNKLVGCRVKVKASGPEYICSNCMKMRAVDKVVALSTGRLRSLDTTSALRQITASCKTGTWCRTQVGWSPDNL